MDFKTGLHVVLIWLPAIWLVMLHSEHYLTTVLSWYRLKTFYFFGIKGNLFLQNAVGGMLDIWLEFRALYLHHTRLIPLKASGWL